MQGYLVKCIYYLSLVESIIIDDYQLVQIKYHDNFSESNLQVIKINSKYYLYFYGNIGEPLSYFH